MLPISKRLKILESLSEDESQRLLGDWRGFWARPSQLEPGTPGAANQRTDWRYWLLKAGRGFGKTKTGAETIRQWAREPLPAPIHLIAPTAADVRTVMVEGSSGILSCYSRGEQRPFYEPSKRKIVWPNGNIAITFSADEPERLRGPQCCRFWADEAAAWRFAEEAWDNLSFGFRIGENIRGIITTTPKPVKLIRDLMKHPATVVTGGSTYENRAFLAKGYFEDVIRKYEGTRLGRQELLAEVLDDLPGALWTRQIIDASRCELSKVPPLIRVVVAIDPAVTANEDSDETGIGCVGLGMNGHCYVLEDASLRGSPNQWARTACRLLLKWNGDRIVAEVNNGGDMVEGALRAIQPGLPYRAVRATRGKAIRAEPVAALYEQGRVHHVGRLELLEDQLCSYVPGVTEKSPDRMDWLVWAITDLVITPEERAIVSVDMGRQISPY